MYPLSVLLIVMTADALIIDAHIGGVEVRTW